MRPLNHRTLPHTRPPTTVAWASRRTSIPGCYQGGGIDWFAGKSEIAEGRSDLRESVIRNDLLVGVRVPFPLDYSSRPRGCPDRHRPSTMRIASEGGAAGCCRLVVLRMPLWTGTAIAVGVRPGPGPLLEWPPWVLKPTSRKIPAA